MWKVTLRGLVAHKLRLLLTGLAVVLGVGFVAGTLILTDTMRQVFDDLFSDAYAGVDVVVRSEAGTAGIAPAMDERDSVPFDLLDTVREVEGVEIAAGTAEGYAQFVDPQGEPVTPMAPTLGVSWTPPEINPLTLHEGREPTAPTDVAVDRVTASEHGFEVGDRATVLLVGGPQQFEVSAVVGFGEADNLAGATLAVFELETALDVLDVEGGYSAIEVGAAAGVEAEEVAERISAVLPADVEAVTSQEVTAEFGTALDEGLGFFSTALLVFAAVALFVGGFIIANTFAIVVAQRTREFAMLRAVGASPAQVTRSVVGEGLLVGLLAGAVGIGVGALLAVGLRSLLDAFGMSVPGGGLVLAPRTVILSLAVALGVTLLSVLVPARRAAKVEPLAALRDVTAAPTGIPRRRVVMGAAVAAVGGLLLAAGLGGWMPRPMLGVGAGALLVFLGVAFLAPLVARPVGSVLSAPAARLGTPGKLAQGNIVRSPRRTAATASALMIGLALVSFVAIFAASLKTSMATLVEESFRGDFLVETPQAAAGFPTGFSPQLTTALRERPELETVSAQRIGFWAEDGSTQVFGGIELESFAELTALDVTEGDLAGVHAGGLLITTEGASARGLDVGDRLAMEFPRTGPTSLEVAATFEPMPALGFSYLVSMDTYEELSTNRLDHFVMVGVADGVDVGRARAVIDDLAAAHPNVVVHDHTELLADREADVDQLLGLITVLLLLAIVIALLGITNTLALSVFERTREIGLLRAVGMSRRQTRSMVRWEALSVALLGALLGVAVGSLFGWAVVGALEDEGIRELAVPAGQLTVYVVVAGLAGVLAGVFPARRAARLDVLEAIATE